MASSTSRSSSSNDHGNGHGNDDDFLVTFRATKGGPKCPFANPVVEFTLRPGGCVCLNGKSGLGKTTLAMVLMKSSSSSSSLLSSHVRFLRQTLDIDIDESWTTWHSSIPPHERCGVLFQQTTLLDELTIAGNLQLALQQYNYYHHHQRANHYNNSNRSNASTRTSTSSGQDGHYYHDEIKRLLELVGLDYARDAPKRPTELSGGMGRRASLALQLAQHKRVIVLDEPFTGLDYDAAVSVAKELVHLRKTQRTALLLISHEPHVAQIVLDPTLDHNNHTITLEEPTRTTTSSTNLNNNNDNHSRPIQPSIFGTTMTHRFLDRLVDYTFYSLPLIVMAFLACGTAIGMLTADLLARLDFAKDIVELVDTHIRPLIKLLTGQDATTFQLMGVRFKVQSLLQQTIPPAKAQLFAIGMTKLMVLEIGPLLTALLLCGRMGGSYAGQVATLHATQQTKLLQTLGVPPLHWTWWPSMGAVVVASPLLTALGTAIALGMAGYIGPLHYGIGTMSQFHTDLRATLFPPLRLKVVEWFQNDHNKEGGLFIRWEFLRELLHGSSSKDSARSAPDFFSLFCVTYPARYSTSSSSTTTTWIETLIEVLTYPPIYHWTKSIVYGLIILSVAQCVTSIHQDHLTPRSVPRVITLSVVVAGLLVIVADWGFSQLWLLRY